MHLDVFWILSMFILFQDFPERPFKWNRLTLLKTHSKVILTQFYLRSQLGTFLRPKHLPDSSCIASFTGQKSCSTVASREFKGFKGLNLLLGTGHRDLGRLVPSSQIPKTHLSLPGPGVTGVWGSDRDPGASDGAGRNWWGEKGAGTELQERPGTESGRSGEHLGSLGSGWLELRGAGTTNGLKGTPC